MTVADGLAQEWAEAGARVTEWTYNGLRLSPRGTRLASQRERGERKQVLTDGIAEATVLEKSVESVPLDG